MQKDREARAVDHAADRDDYMCTMLKDLEELAAAEGHDALAGLLRRAGAEARSPDIASDRVVQMADMIAELKRIAAANGSPALVHHLGHALDEARRVISRRQRTVSHTP